MSEYPELDAIMDGIRSGDQGAYAVAYDHTAGHLASFAHGIVHDRAFAEDAVQQAFLELVTAAPSLRGDGRSLRAWLFRSVRFSCLDELRRRRRHPEVPADRLPDLVERDQGSDLVDPELLAAMDHLTERQRMLVVLRHVVGMDGAEAAAVVGGTRASVYAATQRAERRLRSLLAATDDGDGGA